MDKWSRRIGLLAIATTCLGGYQTGWGSADTSALKKNRELTIQCEKPKPVYYGEWAQAGEVGLVKIRLIFDASENVIDAKIVESSGFSRLDNAALAAAKVVRCRVTSGPKPEIGFVVIVPISFDAE